MSQQFLIIKLSIGGGGDNNPYKFNDTMVIGDGTKIPLREIGDKKLSTFKNLFSCFPDKTPVTFEIEGQMKSTSFDNKMMNCEGLNGWKIQINLKPTTPNFLYIGESVTVVNTRRRNTNPRTGHITLPKWKVTFLLDNQNMSEWTHHTHNSDLGLGGNFIKWSKHIVGVNKRLGYIVTGLYGNGMTCGVYGWRTVEQQVEDEE